MDNYRRSATRSGTNTGINTGSDSGAAEGASEDPTAGPALLTPISDSDRYGNQTADDEAGTPRRRRGWGFWIAVIVVLLLLGGAGAFFGGTIITREETPLPGEAAITNLGLLYVAIPSEYADMRMPSTAKADLNRGKTLFEAECIICHGQNGDGNGHLGRLEYPPATNLHSPDARNLSDGRLFWVIAHGINLSGMPGYGQKYGPPDTKGPYTDDDIWSIIKYVRQQFQSGSASH